MTTPDKDGWIDHDGGPCPVPPETWVQIKNKDGMLLDPAYQADFWAWDDVSAYRIFAPVYAHPPADADEAFIRDTAARVLAAMTAHRGFAHYNADDDASLAIVAAEALAAKLKERKA
jgi:hypothetical protein